MRLVSVEPAAGVRRERLARRARALSWLSLPWMAVEGGVALLTATLSGSVALLRFTGAREHGHAAEERAERLVALSCFLLAPYVATEALRTLVLGERPEQSFTGIARGGACCGSSASGNRNRDRCCV